MSTCKIGILVVNLGTPDAPTPEAIRRYLRQFLSDPRVIDLPALPWGLLLNCLILPLRSRRVAKNYQKIWLAEGSPLRAYTQHLTDKLQVALPDMAIVNGMQYGNPSLIQGLLDLRKKGIEQLIVLPLYPQYSSTTTAAVFDHVSQALQPCPALPAIHFIRDYHDNPLYIEALAAQVRNHWQKNGHAQRLLISFHGIPQRYADKGDPYPKQCLTTATLLANALQLAEHEWQLCFQSRFGNAKWLQPYAVDVLQQLPAAGIRNIDIISPGFAVDCLETLEELALQNRDIFIKAGGQNYTYISALNDTEAQVRLLSSLINTAAHGFRL